MEDINKLLGDRIKTERESQNMQQKDLAKIIGVAPSTIQRYEAGTFKAPKLPVVESIAKYLGVNPLWLLGKSNLKYNDVLPEITSPAEVDPDRFAIQMYKKLDSDDKAEIRGEMKQMLKSDKYNTKERNPNTRLVWTAARSTDNSSKSGFTEMSEKDLETLRNAPRVTSDDDL